MSNFLRKYPRITSPAASATLLPTSANLSSSESLSPKLMFWIWFESFELEAIGRLSEVRPTAEVERLAENRTLRNSEEYETNAEVCDSITMAKMRVYIGAKRESNSFFWVPGKNKWARLREWGLTCVSPSGCGWCNWFLLHPFGYPENLKKYHEKWILNDHKWEIFGII